MSDGSGVAEGVRVSALTEPPPHAHRQRQAPRSPTKGGGSGQLLDGGGVRQPRRRRPERGRQANDQQG
eukprot:7376716-Prymnesium_polylepis.1